MNRYLFSIILLFIVAFAYATSDSIGTLQPPCLFDRVEPSASPMQAFLPQPTRWQKLMLRADRYFLKNVNTDYIGLPRYRFTVALNGDYGSVHTSINCTNLPYYDNVVSQLGSNITTKLGFVVGFRNMSFGYSWDLFRGYSNLKFSLLQNSFGIDLFRRKTTFAGGYIDASSTEGNVEFSSSDIATTTFFVSGYVALNRQKFSMPAAFKASYTQKRSAGSALIVADFIYSRLEFLHDELIERIGGVHEMELYQIAIGAGYGYNYTPNKGKVLLHISATPMLSILNRMIITGDDRMFIPKEVGYNLILSRKLKPAFPVYVTGQAKAAVVYNISSRFVLCFNAVVNNIRFKAKDRMIAVGEGSTITENPEINMRLMTWDWNAVLNFAVRFQ
ncbi:MAG: DUF4421 family protein [Paludibacteraceae bacterium]|nr:DUF4421 family protein [Paludibacteraceae bacterium]